jgi:enoyl-CoA hydratase/carnithine racemase
MLVELTRPEDGIAVLRLNNPPLNLVTLEMTRQLGDALATLADDPAVRAVVLAGAGERAFCAGSDVREFPTLRERVVAAKLRLENEVWARLEDLPQPTIAAIHGWALGGGLELALCCDLRVTDDDARIGLPEIRLGVLPGSGGPIRLVRLIGQSRAKPLVYFGDPITAQEAEQLGLVHRVVPRGQAMAASLDLARRLAAQPAQALRASKRLMHVAGEAAHDTAIAFALEQSYRIFRTDDVLEGVTAFLEKRPPRFRHK